MTDVVDRELEADAAPALDDTDAPERAADAATAPSAAFDLAGPDRWALGALLVGAGVIHLVMAPSHLGESALEGWGFLVSGWLQIGLAVALVLRPARWAVGLTVASNIALVAIWTVSRTIGLPFGAHAHHAESVSAVDGAAVAFEIIAVLMAVSLLLRPGLLKINGGAFAAVVPMAVLAMTSAVIATPQARNHAADSHGDHAAADATGAAAGHAHGGAAPADDKGFSLLGNGHQHGAGDVEIDAETQAALAVQLAGTSRLIEQYPTIAAAEAAGYRRAGPFVPGLGTHFSPPDFNLNADGVVDPGDIDDPLLIYDGLAPDSPLAGFMYMVISDQEPEGFIGPNDHWHYHTNLCIVGRPDGGVDTPLGADLDNVTPEMCSAVGGRLIDYTGYMVHTWTVPGYEAPEGTFHELNSKLTCPDGTYYQIPVEEIGHKSSTCKNP
ncbi:MAG TPA: hypothetical protein VGJ86_13445 [Acidimicrobiales bacterium]|jgi:hypothetical protein